MVGVRLRVGIRSPRPPYPPGREQAADQPSAAQGHHRGREHVETDHADVGHPAGPDGPAGQDGEPGEQRAAEDATADEDRGPKKPSGRVRHDEKMTVYVTSDELLDLEHARVALRRTPGLAVDRGRLVREAVAIALADLEERGEDSVIVQRLKQA